MATGWRKKGSTLLSSARDLALTTLAVGGVQILISLIVWPVLFRSQPQGFSMALTLVGFGGWGIAFVSSFTPRRRPTWGQGSSQQPPGRVPPAGDAPATQEAPAAHPLVGAAQAKVGRFGCGTVLFFSSLIPLALAFVLRVQADMQSGKTWSDIFPAVP